MDYVINTHQSLQSQKHKNGTLNVYGMDMVCTLNVQLSFGNSPDSSSKFDPSFFWIE
jgi:hypothetical protein